MHVASRSYARALRHVATCLCVAYTHTHTHTHTHRSRSAHGGSNDWRKCVHGASICMASAWRRAKRLVQVHASIHARVHLDLGGTTRRVLAQPLGLCPSHPAWSLSLTSCLILRLSPSHPACSNLARAREEGPGERSSQVDLTCASQFWFSSDNLCR